MSRSLIPWLVAGSLIPLAVPVAQAPPGRADEPPVQIVTVDGSSGGRTYDGVGGLSAGASSRLLIDYPEPARSRVLDYLFKPGYGAALQILRVEIGGDVNSTDGAEPSHMRTPTEVDCDRGYEWWLMREAKKRNPSIALSGLAWGAPGWFDGGFWSQDNIDHQIEWLTCARKHGLTIDYLGGWNESEDFDPQWFVDFKRTLREKGFGDTKLIAADGWGGDLETRWKVAAEMARNPEFRAAVDVAAVHYPCGGQYNGAPYDECPSTETAQQLGKPLWSGEQGSQKYDIGAGPMAKAINRSYIDGKMTATVNWSVVASFYTSMPYAGVGFMRAYQPWSGYFEASRSLWAAAHTTQFAKPGWRYVDSASGRLDAGGSVVALRDPATDDYSTILETVDAKVPQRVRIDVDGLSQRRVRVWESDLSSTRQGDWFQQRAEVTPVDGSYELTLKPGSVYSITTTFGQGKGTAAAPADHAWRLPFADGFEATRIGRSPRMFSDFNGAFEVQRCPGRSGRCLGQQVTTKPIEWRYSARTNPFTFVGDPHWHGDYTVGMDVRVDRAPHVDLLGRVDGVLLGQGGQPGYRLRLAADGTWTLIEYAPDRTENRLATGTIPGYRPSQWHRLGMSFQGSRIAAYVDGRRVASADDTRHNRGQVGVLVGDWRTAQFDDLTVKPTGTPPRTIPQHELSATATNARIGFEPGNVLDASPSSMWHTDWDPLAPLPQSITIDLGRARTVRGLQYIPRYDGNPNANITAYRLSTSRDGKTFRAAGSGTWAGDGATKVAAIPPTEVRFLRIEATAANASPYAGAAEINVLR